MYAWFPLEQIIANNSWVVNIVERVPEYPSYHPHCSRLSEKLMKCVTSVQIFQNRKCFLGCAECQDVLPKCESQQIRLKQRLLSCSS